MSFSIIAYDPKTGNFGSACASKWFSVGSAVPAYRKDIGLVHTQSLNYPKGAEICLDSLADGYTINEGIEKALADDPRYEERQYIACDRNGHFAGHNGSRCPKANSLHIDKYCAAAGNTLATYKISEAMTQVYATENYSSMAQRLLRALQAGHALGGDERGKEAAAIKIFDSKYPDIQKFPIDLRVDNHPDPITELQRLLRAYYSIDRSIIY